MPRRFKLPRRSRSTALAWTSAVVAVLALGGAAPALADPAAVLARIDRSAQSVTTLSGEFTQKSRLKLFKQELVSHGRFFFRRAAAGSGAARGQVRWEYTEPDPSTLILDGNKATLRTPGAPAQVFDLDRDATMRTVFDQLFLWLGAGSLERARADYDLEVGGSDAVPVLTLTPHAGSPIAKAFARIELRFDARLLLHEIVLREPSGDDKDILFDKLARDPKLPATAFSP